jgi:aminopeptidase-like protein
MSTTQWTVVDDADRDYTVSISAEARKRLSDEGLRRAANDNQLLAKTALAHEVLAGAACGGIVVAIVWAIFRSL